MELLCVLFAVAALFCGCAVLTLKCRVPAAVAPLTALSLIVAVLTLAAMAGVLYPAAWAVYALCLAGGAWVLLTRKKHTDAPQMLFTPGSVLFWGMALAFTVYFFVRQPMAADFDELSLWATAVKITKVNNDLYATAELGTPWAATQNPGLPLLAYFSSFLALIQIGKFMSVMTFCIFPFLLRLLVPSRAAGGAWPCRWPLCCGACRSSSQTTTTPFI